MSEHADDDVSINYHTSGSVCLEYMYDTNCPGHTIGRLMYILSMPVETSLASACYQLAVKL